MKRILAIVLAALMLVALVACGEQTPENSTPAEKNFKLALGVVNDTSASKDGNVQVETTVVALVLDADGKIVSCNIDAVQAKVAVTDGLLPADLSGKVFETKRQLGDNYNMVTYGGAKAEWYAQADAFCAYVVGKTLDEAKNLAVSDKGVPTDAALSANCTIAVTPFLQAIAKAAACTREFKGTDVKLGLNVNVYADASGKSATAEADGSANIYGDYAAVATDANGKILAALTDSAQAKVGFSATGAITKNDAVSTKRELGDNYNMVTYGGAKAEWYAQAAAFETYVAGKTADEVAAIAITDKGVPTDDALLAGCTIMVDGMMKVVSAAARAAK